MDKDNGGAPPAPKDAAVYVDPVPGEKCENISFTFSGYAPNEEIALEFTYFTDPAGYTFYEKIYADSSGEGIYSWYADVTDGGQYMVWGRAVSAVGSAVFLVMVDDDCACGAACIQF